MTTHSKWESLPTEAINPVSLSVDKAAVPDIIEMIGSDKVRVGDYLCPAFPKSAFRDEPV